MLKITTSKITSLIECKYEEFINSSSKYKLYKDKFKSFLTKHKFDLPEKVFIDCVNKKKRLSLNNVFEFGLNNISQIFLEFTYLFKLLIAYSETLSQIFSSLILRFPEFNLKKLVCDLLYSFINKDNFIKYCLLVMKHKSINEDLIELQKVILESQNHFSLISKKINNELKSMFEKMMNNIKNQNQVKIEPVAYDNSDEDKHESSNETKEIKRVRVIKFEEMKEDDNSIDSLIKFINHNEETDEKIDVSLSKINKGKVKKEKKKVNNPRKRTKSDVNSASNQNLMSNSSIITYSMHKTKSFTVEDKKIFKEEVIGDENTEDEVYFQYKPYDKFSISNEKKEKKEKKEKNQKTITEESTNIDDEDDENDVTVLNFKKRLLNETVHSCFITKLEIIKFNI